MRSRLIAALLLCLAAGAAWGQASPSVDSDHDGLSDALEELLLTQFAPRLMVSREDCSVLPATFAAEERVPRVVSDDGTLYGQAFPVKDGIELHFYHLWRRDCGELGHALDAEHVSALLEQGAEGRWQARYWYAAAHEDTVCDASQITRAATVDAEKTGARVWISAGKHASFLHEELCAYGCGGDRCRAMEELKTSRIVNMGEEGAPMHGAVWVRAAAWPLLDKMRRSDFSTVRVKRLERLPESDIAWANPAKRPMQATILGGNAGAGGAATGVRATDAALAVADDHTEDALGTAMQSTGTALSKSFRNVRKALGQTTRKTGEALGVTP
ncbi:MAG TPA: hypothetical protein VGC07_01650 [Granulicella sp.]